MKVIELKESDFNLKSKSLKTKKLSNPYIVLVYANWCGHCKRFKPIYIESSKILGSVINLCQIDADKSPNFLTAFNVNSFPTILIFKDGKVKEYQGYRGTANEFSGEICKLSMKCSR